jgi:pullulanase/glycogen debranching enzyme
MRDSDWDTMPGNCLGMWLAPLDSSAAIPQPSLLVLFNRGSEAAEFHLPQGIWNQVCDSGDQAPFDSRKHESVCTLSGRSVLLLAQA